MGKSGTRLDELCVELGLFADPASAARAIMAGEVYLADEPVYARAMSVPADAPVHLKERSRFVSRGGEKLEGALAVFGFDPAGLACLDCGASTGGFTDCLLQHGARSVCAVDVGYGQFAWSLRQDSRVRLFERTNINDLSISQAQGPFDLAVADISFAPLHSYLGAVHALLTASATFITLVKPQFEVPKGEVGPGGVVRDAAKHRNALAAALSSFEQEGIQPQAIAHSPITGAKGNIEFLLMGTCGAAPVALDVAACVAQAHNALDE